VRVTVYAGRRVEGAVNTHPFDALRPETVLDVVESLGVPCDGRLFALNSFENRVYLVGREDAEPLIAKFYRPDRLSDAQIFEEHAFLDQLAAEDLPVAAPIRDDAGRSLIEVDIAARLPSEDALGHSSARYRVALFPKLRGRAPELEADEHLEWLGRLIARLHQVGARDHFVHRPPLSIAGLGDAGLAAMLNGPLLPDAMKARFESSVGALLQAVRVAFERVGPLATLRLHGDLHPGNLLWNDEGPAFVDFDDSCAFDWAQAALIEPLRALRLIHYGGWLSARYDDPAFPRAFPFAAQPRFWEEHLLTLEQQAERVTQGG
jgi:Ser/Thr protein kinase RdoA (MazF antagonist)